MIDLSHILGFLAVLLCWALSVVLFRVGTPGSVARRLAWLLVFEGVTLLTNVVYFLGPLVVEANSPADERWQSIVFFFHTLGDCAMIALYPGFLAVALNTKFTRVLAGKGMERLTFVFAAALFAGVMLTPIEVGGIALYVSLTILFTYALVVSIHSWWVADPGMSRDRAKTFAIAFGIRDVCWGFVYFMTIVAVIYSTYRSGEHVSQLVVYIYRGSTLIYVPILAYGILHAHLFDIDLKLRWTIKQSTLAGIFVAVMYLVSEGASMFLEAELGNVAGLLAAAVLMFFLAPLQRLSERVATAAMPHTENTPEYAAFRKMQVYESALAEALQEGGISDKERSLLVHLRNSLEISEADAQAIESDLLDKASQTA